MEELAELRRLLETGQIDEALGLVDALEEMCREDKINKISSYMPWRSNAPPWKPSVACTAPRS